MQVPASVQLAWLNAATVCAQGGADNRKKKRSVFIDDIADVDDDDEDEEIDVSLRICLSILHGPRSVSTASPAVVAVAGGGRGPD